MEEVFGVTGQAAMAGFATAAIIGIAFWFLQEPVAALVQATVQAAIGGTVS